MYPSDGTDPYGVRPDSDSPSPGHGLKLICLDMVICQCVSHYRLSMEDIDILLVVIDLTTWLWALIRIHVEDKDIIVYSKRSHYGYRDYEL